MDSVSQVVLGASVAATIGGRTFGRKTLIWGGVLGTLPDLDTFISYATAIEGVTYHRGFSHSLLALSVFAMALWWLLIRYSPKLAAEKQRLFWLIWACLITHPLLDSFTAYGTQLFWPFQPPPTAFSSIFIIDPLYTLPLLAAVLCYAFRPKRLAVTGWALVITSAYLLWGLLAQALVFNTAEQSWKQKGIHPDSVLVAAAPFTTFSWLLKVAEGDTLWTAKRNVFSLKPIEWTAMPRQLALGKLIRNHPEMQRLRWFTQDKLLYREQNGVIKAIDYRMGSLTYWPFVYLMAEKTATGVDMLSSELEPKSMRQAMDGFDK